MSDWAFLLRRINVCATLLWILLLYGVAMGVFQIAALRTVTRIEESLQPPVVMQPEAGEAGDE